SSGAISLTWFNQPWIRKILEDSKGEIIAYGQVKVGNRSLEIAAPEYEVLGEDDDADDFTRIVPVYPLTEGLMQKTVRRAARAAVSEYLRLVPESLPKWLLESRDLSGIQWALAQIHSPDTDQNRLEARRRLVFEEFFYTQAALA